MAAAVGAVVSALASHADLPLAGVGICGPGGAGDVAA
jgi:hypothetical protein